MVGGQAREGPGEDDDALLARRARLAFQRTHLGEDAGQGDPGRARLDRQQADAVGVAEDGTAGLGLPHVVDDRHAVGEDLVLQPLPGRDVEHLAGADDAFDRGQVVRPAPARSP